MLCHPMSCYAMPSYVTWCYVVFRYDIMSMAYMLVYLFVWYEKCGAGVGECRFSHQFVRLGLGSCKVLAFLTSALAAQGVDRRKDARDVLCMCQVA